MMGNFNKVHFFILEKQLKQEISLRNSMALNEMFLLVFICRVNDCGDNSDESNCSECGFCFSPVYPRSFFLSLSLEVFCDNNILNHIVSIEY